VEAEQLDEAIEEAGSAGKRHEPEQRGKRKQYEAEAQGLEPAKPGEG
jgi:hypothetical protein